MSTKNSKVKTKLNSLNSISRADAIELLVDYGINLNIQSMELTGEVDDQMFKKAIRGIGVLNQLKVPRITIALNTGGGDLFTGLAIYDLIKRNESKVDIVAIGQCMSAGTLILQAADRRYATPQTSFMTHYGSDAVYGNYKDVQRYVKYREELEGRIATIFKERCSWNDHLYEKCHNNDTYFSAAEAMNLNLIDVVD